MPLLSLISTHECKPSTIEFEKSSFLSFRVGTIDLARNQLTKIEFQMFSDLRFIDTIDLAENQISEVQREAFKNIYLTKINMSHNFIEEMADNTFRNCENMTFLDLSHNYLYGILPTVFGDNSYTLDLRLQFNYLTTMAGVPMDHQIGIKVLNVSYNQVRSNFLFNYMLKYFLNNL